MGGNAALLFIILRTLIAERHVHFIINIGMHVPSPFMGRIYNALCRFHIHCHIAEHSAAFAKPHKRTRITDQRHISKTDGLPPWAGGLKHTACGNDDADISFHHFPKNIFRIIGK